MARRDQHTDDSAGFPAGNRTTRPHSPSGWHPERESSDNGDDGGRRGQGPGYGEHDVPTKRD